MTDQRITIALLALTAVVVGVAIGFARRLARARTESGDARHRRFRILRRNEGPIGDARQPGLPAGVATVDGVPHQIVRRVRRLGWYLAQLGPERDLTHQTRNGRLTFSSKDNVIGRRLFVQREWQYDFAEQCIALLVRDGYLSETPGWQLVNVGANVGAILTALMATERFEHCFAFEPESRNIRLLRRNVEQNGLGDRVSIFGVALSDFDGDAEFELSPGNFGDHRIRSVTMDRRDEAFEEGRRQTVTVPVRRLDSTFEEQGVSLCRNSLMWVDIQGHEGRFFRGARRTLANSGPVVSEFWPYGIARSGLSRDAYCRVVCELFDAFYERTEGAWRRHEIAQVERWFDRFSGPRQIADFVFLKTQTPR